MRAGELLFVPRGWWHCVLNLEESVALTHNFVSRAGVGHALRWLKEQPHNVSGVPPRARAALHGRLRAALAARRPELLESATDDDDEEEEEEKEGEAAASSGGGCARRWTGALGAPAAAAPFTFGFSV